MSNMIVEAEHRTMRIDDIAPARSPSFSPNQHSWMKRHAHVYRDGANGDVVHRVREGSRAAKSFGAGTLLIGRAYDSYEGDTDFSGILLMEALCNGAKAERVCYPGIMESLEPVEDFWRAISKSAVAR